MRIKEAFFKARLRRALIDPLKVFAGEMYDAEMTEKELQDLLDIYCPDVPTRVKIVNYFRDEARRKR
jgi:hypothetical protein